MDNALQPLVPVLSENIAFNRLSADEYILSNVRHRHYVKINNETYNLLMLINGSKNLNRICNEYNLKYNKNITAEVLKKVLYETLSDYGVLKGFDEKIKKYQKPAYLKLSFIIINEKILSKVVKYFHFLFHPKTAFTLVFSAIAIVSYLSLTNMELYKAFNLQESLIYFFVIMAVSVTFHEIGHATSADYFGAKHGGIGGGFYLFTPVYYADVTDIWRLNKKQRIIVNVSGMYFELIFCSILALIGYFLNNYILLITAITVCLHTLFNLNPFLRSDGYWILSDLMNKPNLLYHSFNKVKDFFSIFLGKKVNWKPIDIFLFFYGAISMSAIAFFLYYVLIKNPDSLIMFPKNLIDFISNVFKSNSEISIENYAKLIVPLIFYFLLFNLVKSAIKKIIKKKGIFRF